MNPSISNICNIHVNTTNVSPSSLFVEQESVENKICQLLKKHNVNIRESDLWKILFMERKFVVEGKAYYENEEQGYLKGIKDSFLLMLETLDVPLTPELYVELHDRCVEKMVVKGEKVPLGFRTHEDGAEAFYLILNETVSQQGCKELVERHKKYSYKESDTGNVFYLLKEAMVNPTTTVKKELTEGSPSIRLRPTRKETCYQNFMFCLGLYLSMPKNSEIEKLHAIIRLSQDLDQFHLFVDGNIRTTGILLINKLLLQEGLPLTSLEDVNVLDGLSVDEIVEKIREGQRYVSSLSVGY